MARVAVLDCDVRKNFPASVGFQYYGDRIAQWLGDPADGDGWTWTMFRVSEAGAISLSFCWLFYPQFARFDLALYD